jgi:hypothetical protein
LLDSKGCRGRPPSRVRKPSYALFALTLSPDKDESGSITL